MEAVTTPCRNSDQTSCGTGFRAEPLPSPEGHLTRKGSDGGPDKRAQAGRGAKAEVPLSGPKSPGKPATAAAGTVHRPLGVTPGLPAHLAQELSLSVTKQHQGKAVVDAVDGPIGQECDEPTDGGEHPDGC